MKVYVVMGNDYPEAVFVEELTALQYCKKRDAENKKGVARIHWAYYEFELQK